MSTYYVMVNTQRRRPYTVRGLRFDTREAGEAHIKSLSNFSQTVNHIEGRLENKDTRAAMTCQCCGRKIKANIGMSIAHHGYERPDAGYQTSSCYGARAYPFEVSRGKLGQLIDNLADQLARMKQARDEVDHETQPIRLSWKTSRRHQKGHDFHYFDMTRDNIDSEEGVAARRMFSTSMDFDAFKARDLRERHIKIAGMIEYIREQQERYDAWVQTHKQHGKTWIPITE